MPNASKASAGPPTIPATNILLAGTKPLQNLTEVVLEVVLVVSLHQGWPVSSGQHLQVQKSLVKSTGLSKYYKMSKNPEYSSFTRTGARSCIAYDVSFAKLWHSHGRLRDSYRCSSSGYA